MLPSDAPESPSRRRFLLLLSVVPFLLLALWRMTEGAGLGTDDHAQYLMHAEAIAEGRPYADILYIYNPFSPYIGPRAEPPGFPLMVAAVFIPFGQNFFLAKLMLLGLALGFVILAGRYFAEHADLRLGLGVAALCGLDPVLAHRSVNFFSDVPFCALVWATICLADAPGPWHNKRILGVTALGAAAIAVRPVGVALVGALLLYSLIRFREHRWRPLVPVGILLAGGLAMVVALPLLTTGVASQVTWDKLFLYTAQNVGTLSMAVLESHLYPLPWNIANDAYHVVSGLVMVVGLGAWLRTGYARFATMFAVTYVAMFVVLPAATRYFWPLYPFFVFGLLNGVRVLVGLLRPALSLTQSVRVALTAGGIIGIMAVSKDLTADRKLDLADLPDAQELFSYLRRADAADPIRIMFSNPRVLAWETGIATMPPSEIPTNILNELVLGCITHVITQDLGIAPGQDSAARTAIETAPEAFRMEFENASFRVFQYLDARCGPEGRSG